MPSSTILFGATSILGYSIAKLFPDTVLPFVTRANRAKTIRQWPVLNLEDPAWPTEVFAKHQPDLFIQCHAVCDVPRCEVAPHWAREVNIVYLKRVLDAIAGGTFSPGEPERYRGLIDGLLNRDTYLLMADFADYVATQGRVDALWRDKAAWAQCAISNVAAMGPFSSDRTVREYVDKVWTAPLRR